uniref:Uncharacterized protein n=2 Tax=Schistocephalus solidus TaxID=70667 RepID=A0A0X3PQH6_SCHSO
MFNLPKKMLLLDTLSLCLIWCIHGWEFTIVILVISIAFSVLGAYIGRSPLFMLFLGLLFLTFIQDMLRFCLPEAFVFRMFAARVSYPGFYASVVRAIILGIEHARMPSVSLRDLLRNSIGYTVMSPVCMPASFVLFQDWMKWREVKTKFTVQTRHHLEEERDPADRGESVRRTVSFRRSVVTLFRLGFWTLVLKYGLGSINFTGQLCGPVRRISRGVNVGLLDGFIAYFIAFLNVGKFHVYYVVFYGYGRTIGDLQQFVMSPLFERDTSRLVIEQQDPQSTLSTKLTQDFSLGEKLICSELTMNCFMPDGPSCLLGTLKSSEVWRTFDRGLYIVMKHYIYFPWRKFLASITPATSVVLKELGALSGAVLTFIFVLTFHSWSKGNRVWVCASFVLWSIERFAVKYYNSMRVDEKLTSLLSTEWEITIRGLGYAALQVLNILCFMFFFANYDAGFWLVKAVLTNWFVPLQCWAFLFLVLRLSIQAHTWSTQETGEINKDK